MIAQAIDRLPEKEKIGRVAVYYYDELTMKEIGKVLSYTESRICQIHSKNHGQAEGQVCGNISRNWAEMADQEDTALVASTEEEIDLDIFEEMGIDADVV